MAFNLITKFTTIYYNIIVNFYLCLNIILPYYDDVIISMQKQAFISLIQDVPQYKRIRLVNFINSMDPSELILLDNNVAELISRYTDSPLYSEDSDIDDTQDHQHVDEETEDVDEETEDVDEETEDVDEETEDVDEETEDTEDAREETEETENVDEDVGDVKNLSEYSDEYEYTQDYTKKNN